MADIFNITGGPFDPTGGDGLNPPTAGSTSDGMDEKLVDAKIALSEARTDTKFAKMEGKLDLILSELKTVREQSVDSRSEARTTRRTVVGTGISLAALMIAAFSLYVNSFSLGSRVDDVARIEAEQTVNRLMLPPPATQAVPQEQRALPAPENATKTK